MVNLVVASVAIVFYLIATIGAGLVFLGYRMYRSEGLSARMTEVRHV